MIRGGRIFALLLLPVLAFAQDIQVRAKGLGPTKDANVFWTKTNLLIEFSVHGLLGSLSPLDATLWEQP